MSSGEIFLLKHENEKLRTRNHLLESTGINAKLLKQNERLHRELVTALETIDSRDRVMSHVADQIDRLGGEYRTLKGLFTFLPIQPDHPTIEAVDRSIAELYILRRYMESEVNR